MRIACFILNMVIRMHFSGNQCVYEHIALQMFRVNYSSFLINALLVRGMRLWVEIKKSCILFSRHFYEKQTENENINKKQRELCTIHNEHVENWRNMNNLFAILYHC